MAKKSLFILLLCGSLCASSSPGIAQQGGAFLGKGIGPSKAEIVGAIVGAAAVIGIVVYLVVPKQKTIEGCLDSQDGGLRLTIDKDKHSYALVSNEVNLQPGQRVTLKGKPGKKHSGTPEFRINKVLKSEGACGAQTSIRP